MKHLYPRSKREAGEVFNPGPTARREASQHCINVCKGHVRSKRVCKSLAEIGEDRRAEPAQAGRTPGSFLLVPELCLGRKNRVPGSLFVTSASCVYRNTGLAVDCASAEAD
jgi:hypothetical protein